MKSVKDEYQEAVRLGKKEYNECLAAQKETDLPALDDLLPEVDKMTIRDLGSMEIPAERIIGTKTAGRTAAFSPSFLPLMPDNTEFAIKWQNLCAAHLSDTGIREPIQCYEYLGNFYVQEGNKRVSVLRYFGAPRIPATVKRVMPVKTEEPRIRAYFEFLEFYKLTKLYTVQFRRPQDYGKLLSYLGKDEETVWTEEERRTFNSRFSYFRDAIADVNTEDADILPEEALLLWLQLYPYEDLSTLTTTQLKKSVSALWSDMVSTSEERVVLETKVEETAKPGLITRIISAVAEPLQVAFVQQLNPTMSGWAKGHEQGIAYLREQLGDKIEIRTYYDANTAAKAEEIIETAVADGAHVVFTTVPQLSKPTLKAAVKYPKVFFFNCSVDQPYSSIRTYYARVYEAKFITGAIAGAMTKNDRIGYLASYPIFGVPASINAFALGAQFTNPRARIDLRWNCVPGNPLADFLAEGIRVISNRDLPVSSKTYLDFCNYGTYLADEQGVLIPLASPIWAWGKFYETVIRGILAGTLKNEKTNTARNYWLGLDSGAVDIDLSEKLPAGVWSMALLLKKAIASGELNPFARRITDQQGNVRNEDETKTLSMDAIMRMDWLCENITGSIPTFTELRPEMTDMVRELGIYRSEIPV